MVIKLGILEVGAKRPTLLASYGGFSNVDAPSRTVSMTLPANTDMLVAVVCAGDASSMSPSTPQFDGVDMAAASAIVEIDNTAARAVVGIYYKLAPTTGVSKNLTWSFNSIFNNNLVRAYALANAASIAMVDSDSSADGSSVTNSLTVSNKDIIISGLAQLAQDSSPETGPTTTLNNIDLDITDTEAYIALTTAHNLGPVSGAISVNVTETDVDWVGSFGRSLLKSAVIRS